jgi:hypothetical protein
MELVCEAPNCDFVLWPVPDPTRKTAVEAAHRNHRGDLRFDSGWYASCSCGWSSPKVGQDLARKLLAAHIDEMIQNAVRGEQ